MHKHQLPHHLLKVFCRLTNGPASSLANGPASSLANGPTSGQLPHDLVNVSRRLGCFSSSAARAAHNGVVNVVACVFNVIVRVIAVATVPVAGQYILTTIVGATAART
jgi:hypothetical protein